MDTLKKFAKYIIWIVLFWIFSDVLIFFGLNASYDNLTVSENNSLPPQIEIEQAEATLVNGRIKGKIKNDGEEDLNGKYMKVDLFSPRNVLLGTKYMQISDLEKGATDNFELFFKAQDVEHFNISFIDKIKESEEELKRLQIPFIDRPLTGYELIGILITLMIIG